MIKEMTCEFSKEIALQHVAYVRERRETNKEVHCIANTTTSLVVARYVGFVNPPIEMGRILHEKPWLL
jgi:hypothetical protein